VEESGYLGDPDEEGIKASNKRMCQGLEYFIWISVRINGGLLNTV
jgi:hypothetical protein